MCKSGQCISIKKSNKTLSNRVVCVYLLVVLCRKGHAGWVERFFRLYSLLESVDGLTEQDLIPHRIPTMNDQAKDVGQLNWYWAHFLITKKQLRTCLVFCFQTVELKTIIRKKVQLHRPVSVHSEHVLGELHKVI